MNHLAQQLGTTKCPTEVIEAARSRCALPARKDLPSGDEDDWGEEGLVSPAAPTVCSTMMSPTEVQEFTQAYPIRLREIHSDEP